MTRTIAGFLTVCLLAYGFATAPVSAKPSLEQLGDQILNSLQSFYPVHATSMGIHEYDHLLTDYSSGSVKAMVKKLSDFQKAIYPYRGAELAVEDRIKYQLLKSNLDMALLDLNKIKWQNRSPQLYVDEAVNGLYFLMLNNYAPLSERLPSIIGRMKEVPKLFETARKNIKDAPEVYIEAAIESLEAGSGFYQQAAGTLMREFPDRADEILKVSTQAREAMNDFSAYLAGMTRTEAHGFAIGANNFDYMLSNGLLLPYNADSLLKLGEALLAQAQTDYREYAAYMETNRQNGADSVFVPSTFTRRDILDYYQWETDQVRIFCEMKNLISVPKTIAPVQVVETPAFLRPMIGGIAYEPAGPFDRVQTAVFYVRPIPEDLSAEQLAARYRFVHRRGFRGSVVHEAYPGHHLQLQIAALNTDPVRKWQQNILLIEGWALYCEEMTYHAGLYGKEDPAQWLSILGGIRFRAARIVADVKLHTGQFTYDECVNWMISALDARTDSDKDYIRTEVRRYTISPTVQLSYLIGKMEIEKLREKMLARDGDRFLESDFNDQLLTQGAIPPSLIGEALDLK
jgi:uncharacterized protein (DUF885 family)